MKDFLVEVEDYRKQKRDWKILKNLFPRFKPHVWSLGFCGLLLAVFSLLSLSSPLLVRHALDVNFPEKDNQGLLLTSALYLMVLVLSFGFNYFQQVRLETVGQAIIRKLRIDIFEHITFLPQSFFDRYPVGKIMSRVESDTEALRTMFTQTVITIVSDLLMMFGMFIVMFSISFRLTLILLSVAPFVVIIIKYFNGKIIPIFIEVRRRTAEIYGFLEEYMMGVKIVQVFDQEKNVIARMNTVNKEKVDVEYPGERLSNYFAHSVFLTSTIATVLILGFGGHWAMERPDLLSIGTLVAFLGYIQRFFGPIFHLSEQMNVIQRAFAGASHIDEILSIPRQTVNTDQPCASSMIESSETQSATKGIEFRNVWFAYKNDDWILQDVSFFLPRGKKFAVVGPTGGGKTTLISLLFRFYDPQKGQIFLDGRDISTMPFEDLRRHLALVMQDIVLFPGSLLDNLRLEDGSITESQVMDAIRMVKAEDIVLRNPLGLLAPLSEHGNNLSVGERQLLSFARALVFNPQCLVLDEATSSVDPLTESKVQNAIDTLLQNRTALIVAHRLQTILECDEIMVIQNGRIVERGSHDDLIALGQVYYNLYQIQHGFSRSLQVNHE